MIEVALDIVLNAAKCSLNKHTPAHPDKVRWACDVIEKAVNSKTSKVTVTPRPHISQCCRQDEDGELVDKSEYSDSDVTLAVVHDDGIYCMECNNKLYSNTHVDEPTIADGEGFLPKGTNVEKWLKDNEYT
jgi:hypothetical protein